MPDENNAPDFDVADLFTRLTAVENAQAEIIKAQDDIRADIAKLGDAVQAKFAQIEADLAQKGDKLYAGVSDSRLVGVDAGKWFADVFFKYFAPEMPKANPPVE